MRRPNLEAARVAGGCGATDNGGVRRQHRGSHPYRNALFGQLLSLTAWDWPRFSCTKSGQSRLDGSADGNDGGFCQLQNCSIFSEVLGVPGVVKGTYTGALITLDYSAAQIIYDDGSLAGVALTPVDAKGKALGLVTVGVTLDPGEPIVSAAKQVGRLALDFNLAASNVVNLNARTAVTITPMVAAKHAADRHQAGSHQRSAVGREGHFFHERLDAI